MKRIDVGLGGGFGALEKMEGACVDSAESEEEVETEGGAAMVVDLVRLVVSAEGGGGREVRTLAFQRKHSPVPKYLGEMCG